MSSLMLYKLLGSRVAALTWPISLERRTPLSWKAHMSAALQSFLFPFGIFVLVPGMRTLAAKVASLHISPLPSTNTREFPLVCTAVATLVVGPAITFFMSDREPPSTDAYEVRGAPTALAMYPDVWLKRCTEDDGARIGRIESPHSMNCSSQGAMASGATSTFLRSVCLSATLYARWSVSTYCSDTKTPKPPRKLIRPGVTPSGPADATTLPPPFT